ncbi:hypothetical protein CEXT_96061 [Caerostris extrusa]|uniref:Uncharacterized protein n=1 Tax=Caerostris extrusa TaxID=172846 RepID=A0AAV4W3K8_CAEEX|nr:hypothetical protein CEXT_96061 [Caerostris extrusa]
MIKIHSVETVSLECYLIPKRDAILLLPWSCTKSRASHVKIPTNFYLEFLVFKSIKYAEVFLYVSKIDDNFILQDDNIDYTIFLLWKIIFRSMYEVSSSLSKPKPHLESLIL